MSNVAAAGSNAIHSVATFYTAALAEAEEQVVQARKILEVLNAENANLKRVVGEQLRDPVRDQLVAAAMDYVGKVAWENPAGNDDAIESALRVLIGVAQALADQRKQRAAKPMSSVD